MAIFLPRTSGPSAPIFCATINDVVPALPTGETRNPVGAVLKKSLDLSGSWLEQLGTTVKRQNVPAARSSALKSKSLIFLRKNFGDIRWKRPVFETHGERPAKPQNCANEQARKEGGEQMWRLSLRSGTFHGRLTLRAGTAGAIFAWYQFLVG